jgi:hypothetical protein
MVLSDDANEYVRCKRVLRSNNYKLQMSKFLLIRDYAT